MSETSREFPRWMHKIKEDGSLDSKVVRTMLEEDKLEEGYFDTIGEARAYAEKQRVDASDGDGQKEAKRKGKEAK